MRRYLIALGVVALLVGSFYRGADQTGMAGMRMFGLLGIFLLGVIGTMAVTRWQSRSGVKATEAALKSLEPHWVLTDWAFQGNGRPDYLAAGPGGIVAVCLDETPGYLGQQRAEARIVKARQRARASVYWVRERLGEAAPAPLGPLGDTVHELPVQPIVVMLRRPAQAEDSADGVTVLNADQLSGHVASLWGQTLLTERDRIQLTRLLRRAGGR